MRADFDVVLDACVLANFSVCDLFLRLAETPRLYVPKWTSQILDEVYRTHVEKLGWDERLAGTFTDALRENFPDSEVRGYERLITVVENDAKDRHVLAAAIRAKSEIIVTFNLKHFPTEALVEWGIAAVHPGDYLITLYRMHPSIVIHQLESMASKSRTDIFGILGKLALAIPAFSMRVRDDIEG